MKINATRLCLSLAALLLSATTALHAELPKNSDVWKSRCNLLTSLSVKIASGATPPALVAATHGISGEKLNVMAINRSQAGEHYVACAVYYLAAIAYRAGNGGKPDPKWASDDTILAAADLRLAQHQHLTTKQHMKRVELKIDDFGKTLELNADETGAILDAINTLPVTLDTKPDPVMSSKAAAAAKH